MQVCWAAARPCRGAALQRFCDDIVRMGHKRKRSWDFIPLIPGEIPVIPNRESTSCFRRLRELTPSWGRRIAAVEVDPRNWKRTRSRRNGQRAFLDRSRALEEIAGGATGRKEIAQNLCPARDTRTLAWPGGPLELHLTSRLHAFFLDT